MSMKMKILAGLVILINLGVLVTGCVSWANSYGLERQIFSGLLIASGVFNLLLGYLSSSEERRLEKRLKIARLKKDLAELGA